MKSDENALPPPPAKDFCANIPLARVRETPKAPFFRRAGAASARAAVAEGISLRQIQAKAVMSDTSLGWS